MVRGAKVPLIKKWSEKTDTVQPGEEKAVELDDLKVVFNPNSSVIL